MNKVLILSPLEFLCFAKFKRKISRITSNLQNVTLVFCEDHHGFIKKLADELSFQYMKINELEITSVTHAIIFDDDSSIFQEEYELLSQHNVLTRKITISITKVINIKTDPHFQELQNSNNYEYIGRGSYWGNPYSMFEEGEDREEVIRKFKYDFDRDLFPNKDKKEVYKLMGKTLGCFCKPNNCHGDILANFLNSYDDGK